MKRVAIITARGGSKRIPKKNIKDFCGKPIIEYSIKAALDAKIFDEVMVSTDSKEIAEIALACGAKVPFMRSENTANDYATTADVIREVIDTYEKANQVFDTCVCIYPTAPFVTAQKLINGVELLENNKADAVVPVVRFSFPPQRGFIIDKTDGYTRPKHPECIPMRSQDLEPMYHDCGQFYCLNVEAFKTQNKIFMDKMMSIEVEETEVQDIDNETDWIMAELKWQCMNAR